MSAPRLPDPTPCPGGYSIDLYCDRLRTDLPNHRIGADFPEQATGETRGEAQRAARISGWVLHRDGTATCPRCV